MSSRRRFIKNISKGVFVLGAGYVPTDLLAAQGLTKVSILHTNDFHSRIDPFPMDGGKYQGLGGVARRAALIKEIRTEEKHVLLLDSGDILQGTPYFNFYDGELEFRLMDEMKYDAATIGNHDFDCGIERLSELTSASKFSMLNANYNFEDTPMAGLAEPYKVFNFENVKIGVFGLGIKLQGLVPEKLFGKSFYEEPIAKAQKTSKILKTELDCDLVICLSHLGFRYDSVNQVSDVILAQESKHIDLILGGHTHTFLDELHLEKNQKNKRVMINQVGWAGIHLGRIDVFFDKGFSRKHISNKQILIR